MKRLNEELDLAGLLDIVFLLRKDGNLRSNLVDSGEGSSTDQQIASLEQDETQIVWSVRPLPKAGNGTVGGPGVRGI